MRRFSIVIMMVLLLTGFMPVSAKGVVDKVTLSGSFWYGDVEITEPELLEHLALGVFTNFEKEFEGPPLVSSGVLMTRAFKADDDYQLLDRLLYFPGKEPGQGVVYYVGLANGASQLDGTWYQVRPESEARLLRWLSAEGVLPASISFEPAQPRRSSQTPTPLMIGGLFFVSLALGFALGRRSQVLSR